MESFFISVQQDLLFIARCGVVETAVRFLPAVSSWVLRVSFLCLDRTTGFRLRLV